MKLNVFDLFDHQLYFTFTGKMYIRFMLSLEISQDVKFKSKSTVSVFT